MPEMTKEILAKIKRGDGITDAELKIAIEWYRDLTDKLDMLHPQYYLAWKDAYYILLKLQDFDFSRKHCR